MKVIQINAVYEYSSTGRTTKEMHEYLISHGIESFVFCNNAHIPEKFIYSIADKFGTDVHSLMSHLFDMQGLCSWRSTKKMISKIHELNPDIVILRNLHSNYVNYPMILRFLASYDIPTIVVLHDVWLFTGHCCYYTADNCERWLSGCGNCPAKHKYNKSIILDRSESNFNLKRNFFNQIPRLAVIGVSDWVKDEAKKSPVFVNATEISRIYNWIDLNKFRPINYQSANTKIGICNRFTLLSVAQSWSDAKGLPTILEIAKRLPSDLFILVGKMDYSGELPGNIVSVGVISDTEKLAQFYSMADVLLVCSVQETFGKVSAEALACGTPVIANNSTANPEIAGKECGFTFNNFNIDEIISSISFLKQKGGKAAYITKCRQRAVALFDFEKQMQSYLQLFNRLVGGGNYTSLK